MILRTCLDHTSLPLLLKSFIFCSYYICCDLLLYIMTYVFRVQKEMSVEMDCLAKG